MRPFSFRLTNGNQSRHLTVQALSQIDAEVVVEKWCKDRAWRWRWPIFSWE